MKRLKQEKIDEKRERQQIIGMRNRNQFAEKKSAIQKHNCDLLEYSCYAIIMSSLLL